MGYLTTLTIYNDGVHLIKKKSKELCEKIYLAALDGRKVNTIGHIDHVNLITVQKCRHADDHTIYVHMGNTLCEMNAYSKETLEIMKRNPEYFKNMLSEMEWQVKELKKKFKESQDGAEG